MTPHLGPSNTDIACVEIFDHETVGTTFLFCTFVFAHHLLYAVRSESRVLNTQLKLILLNDDF